MNKYLNVLYHRRKVGVLAETNDRKVAFEYNSEWLKDGFSISPFSLPLKKQVFIPEKDYFQGLYGVFADSLPDAWGNILLNRLLAKRGISSDEISMLDRLAIVGSSGMGALTYEPEHLLESRDFPVYLDEIAAICQKILLTEYSENLDKLYKLGGTSGGTRPKILTKVDQEEWIIKFPAHVDGTNSGCMEYDYAQCALNCGIEMMQTRLFSSKVCKGYFGTKRFDRNHINRVHMCTAAALLELDFTQPSLDYHSLMKLTKILTRDDEKDLEEMYRRMCFNVFAHNRDDHAKNFTFLYNEKQAEWQLSPAYDLTYSSTYYGEHTTTVDGNGKNPTSKELIAVGVTAGMHKKRCLQIAEEIKGIVEKDLRKYLFKE